MRLPKPTSKHLPGLYQSLQANTYRVYTGVYRQTLTRFILEFTGRPCLNFSNRLVLIDILNKINVEKMEIWGKTMKNKILKEKKSV